MKHEMELNVQGGIKGNHPNKTSACSEEVSVCVIVAYLNPGLRARREKKKQILCT